ncbi:MAG: hypothetical protein A2W25_05150 [candidate division Zixibacteria bacterium RBG_16_53_22]|nr:MAG: hypothetical protein A2W25_05150 [candidate division Zixibacteria bacterium RBG_16_53_22]
MGVTRGIYAVAFGDPARRCAQRMLQSARCHLPEIPVMICSTEPLGGEDYFVPRPDRDIGGRGTKLMAYELTPPEWQTVLYLDADTEIVGDIRLYFQLIEDGWEFVICKDPMREDVAQLPRHKYMAAELVELEASMGTLHTLMLNGGVWSFARNERVAAFFTRWQAEWQRHGMRDQGALLRALYADPLKVYILGNEWNFFPQYSSRITKPAGLMHYPGQARRWSGQIPGRLDSQVAWQHVRQWLGANVNGRGRR